MLILLQTSKQLLHQLKYISLLLFSRHHNSTFAANRAPNKGKLACNVIKQTVRLTSPSHPCLREARKAYKLLR